MSDMIAQLRGQILELTSESLTLDVQGVGYELTCSSTTLADLQAEFMGGMGLSAKAQKTQTLFVYTHVREDLLQLFGFSTKIEKLLFQNLLKVNGIGPKMAINILSGASVQQVQHMIELEDVKSLSKLPKVGKKTAEQMILTLKGKLVIHPQSREKSAATAKPVFASTTLQDISSALVNLGFRSQDVEQVVSALPEKIELQEGIRQGLVALSGGG